MPKSRTSRPIKTASPHLASPNLSISHQKKTRIRIWERINKGEWARVKKVLDSEAHKSTPTCSNRKASFQSAPTVKKPRPEPKARIKKAIFRHFTCLNIR